MKSSNESSLRNCSSRIWGEGFEPRSKEIEATGQNVGSFVGRHFLRANVLLHSKRIIYSVKFFPLALSKSCRQSWNQLKLELKSHNFLIHEVWSFVRNSFQDMNFRPTPRWHGSIIRRHNYTGDYRRNKTMHQVQEEGGVVAQAWKSSVSLVFQEIYLGKQ